MRFTAYQDYQTILKFNKELLNVVVDTPVIIYKVNLTETKLNIYGESLSKAQYVGVQVSCLINRPEVQTNEDVGITDIDQMVQFAFLRTTLEEKNIYVEIGDVVWFDSSFYEINTTNEVQLYAGQVLYNHQILADAHLMRVVPSQLQSTIL